MNPKPRQSLDIKFVRSRFPAFAQPLPAKTAFFENAGGSYVAGAVLERLIHFYRDNKVQPYGASEICAAAGAQMDRGREAMAGLLGVPADTLTLGPSTTQNINTLALACSPLVGAGDKVIVSEQDHEANIGAWERLCRRNRAEFVLWKVEPESGELSLEVLRGLLDARVKILCMTHGSNILGTINPVEEVLALCRKNGTRVVIDGVSCAPHRWPELPALQPDAYCFSTYKTYATHLGVLYTAPDFAALLDPQCHFFNCDYPHKQLDAAGPDHAAIAALAGLEEYFVESYRHHFGEAQAAPSLHQQALAVSKLMHEHEQILCAPLLEAVQQLPLRIIGRDTIAGREANVALVSEGRPLKELAAGLAAGNIAVGHGNFYAKRLLDAVGVDSDDGVLRISFAHYNSEEEVERVVRELRGMH